MSRLLTDAPAMACAVTNAIFSVCPCIWGCSCQLKSGLWCGGELPARLAASSSISCRSCLRLLRRWRISQRKCTARIAACAGNKDGCDTGAAAQSSEGRMRVETECTQGKSVTQKKNMSDAAAGRGNAHVHVSASLLADLMPESVESLVDCHACRDYLYGFHGLAEEQEEEETSMKVSPPRCCPAVSWRGTED